MKDEDLENILISLSPVRPSAALAKRVDDELAQDLSWAVQPPRRAPLWLPPLMWATIGAAAAIVVMGLGEKASTTAHDAALAATPVPAVLPVSTIREVVEAQDEGIRYNAESRLPEQHMRIVSLERRAWIDPRDGAQITVEVPREDSIVLPVSFQ